MLEQYILPGFISDKEEAIPLDTVVVIQDLYLLRILVFTERPPNPPGSMAWIRASEIHPSINQNFPSIMIYQDLSRRSPNHPYFQLISKIEKITSVVRRGDHPLELFDLLLTLLKG